MKNRLVLCIASIMLTLTTLGQQDPTFSHSMFNQMAVNPAFAGSDGMICATAINRQQWVGFGEGTPNTTVVNINAAISPFGLSSGIGLNILNDQFGFNNDLGVDLSYAVRFDLEGIGKLALGLNGGFINNSLDPTWNFPEGSGDAAVPQATESAINFDFGAGVFFNNDEMYFGLSATHLNESQYYNEYTTHYKRHFYLTGGYYLDMPNESWQFNPSVFIATDLTTNQLSLTANVIYNKKFWGGVTYRVGEAVVGMVGLELFSGMRVGYAYDYSISDIGGYNGGSHEFMLGYCFTLKREQTPQQYKSIRFL
ncbi:MAG: type IX secretion system membrane protein PorP/SprF [Perlabentimonas sp.]